MLHPIERVVLLGYMCSGKSTVAAALGRRLEWQLIDFDTEIEHREGRPVADIISSAGEDYFRALEATLTEEVASSREVVLAPGGGWITRPELLRAMPEGTFAVWLSVTPEETVRRLMNDPSPRPLRDHPDPISAVSEMLRDREPLYRLADARVPTDGRTPEKVAFEIEQTLRTRGI